MGPGGPTYLGAPQRLTRPLRIPTVTTSMFQIVHNSSKRPREINNIYRKSSLEAGFGREHCSHVHERLFTVHGIVYTVPCTRNRARDQDRAARGRTHRVCPWLPDDPRTSQNNPGPNWPPANPAATTRAPEVGPDGSKRTSGNLFQSSNYSRKSP